MFNQFLKDESGQDIVEYSLLLVLIGAAAIIILATMGTSISNVFNKINAKLQSADERISQAARRDPAALRQASAHDQPVQRLTAGCSDRDTPPAPHSNNCVQMVSVPQTLGSKELTP
jgi:pilus assembly protein Flp/PilA